MKPILIDELVENNDVASQETVVVDGVQYLGYQIAKPLNYDEEYLSYKDRVGMAMEVLKGKAIAVRYFCDLTDEEKAEYIKNKLK